MNIMEIILLAAGGITFAASFFIPDRKGTGDGNSKALAEDEIKKLVKQELESIRSHVDDVVEEAVTYAMEKTERSLERLSNEKIMAVSEYSDTVLAEIHKDHEEAMFLYDMLNNKQVSLKNTVSEINRTIKEAEDTVTAFQKFTPEVMTPQTAEGMQEETPAAELRISEGHAPLAQASSESVNKPAGGKNRSKRNSSRRSSSNKNFSSNKNSSEGGQAVSAGGASETGRRQENSQGEKPIQRGQDEREKSGQQSGQNQQEYHSNERILALYQEGKSALEIAKVLDIGVGEVTLVIDLFQK